MTEQRAFQQTPARIVYCYGVWQPRFAGMKKKGIRFHQGIPTPSHLGQWFEGRGGDILVLDDLMEEGGNDKRVLAWRTLLVYTAKIHT